MFRLEKFFVCVDSVWFRRIASAGEIKPSHIDITLEIVVFCLQSKVVRKFINVYATLLHGKL